VRGKESRLVRRLKARVRRRDVAQPAGLVHALIKQYQQVHQLLPSTTSVRTPWTRVLYRSNGRLVRNRCMCSAAYTTSWLACNPRRPGGSGACTRRPRRNLPPEVPVVVPLVPVARRRSRAGTTFSCRQANRRESAPRHSRDALLEVRMDMREKKHVNGRVSGCQLSQVTRFQQLWTRQSLEPNKPSMKLHAVSSEGGTRYFGGRKIGAMSFGRRLRTWGVCAGGVVTRTAPRLAARLVARLVAE
jgi:hypothetical protein